MSTDERRRLLQRCGIASTNADEEEPGSPSRALNNNRHNDKRLPPSSPPHRKIIDQQSRHYDSSKKNKTGPLVHDEEYENSALHNIDHPDHELHGDAKKGREYQRCFMLCSHSRPYRRRVVFCFVIWLAFLAPTVWLPLERLDCPRTFPSSNGTFENYTLPSTHTSSSTPFFASKHNDDLSSDFRPHRHHHHHQNQHRQYDLYFLSSPSSNSSDNNNTNNNDTTNVPFCEKSLDPGPLRWTAGLAILVSLVCLVLHFTFAELAERNVCHFTSCADLCGVLPSLILRLMTMLCVFVSISIQFFCLRSSVTRPDCPSINAAGVDDADSCVLYRATEATFGLAIVSLLCLIFSFIYLFCQALSVDEKREDLTRGVVKTILEAEKSPTLFVSEEEEKEEEDDADPPGSPYFAPLMHKKVCIDKCECDNCCCNADSGGCCFSIASCLDVIKYKYEHWYHVDGRCSCECCCCCGGSDEEYIHIDSGDNESTSPKPTIGFKAMKTYGIILGILGSISPIAGYFTVISLLIVASHEGTPWQLSPIPDQLFTCNNLFPTVQEIPAVHRGEASVLYRLDGESNNEVMICTNMSASDPEIHNLPGILRSPNYVEDGVVRTACNRDLEYIRAHCGGTYCPTAFLAPPRPFGVFWSYSFSDIGSNGPTDPCVYNPLPRTGVPTCTGSHIIRVSGYGESLLGSSFQYVPFYFAMLFRFSTFAMMLFFGLVVCGRVVRKPSEATTSSSKNEDDDHGNSKATLLYNRVFEKGSLFAKHKKTFLGSYLSEIPIINLFIAFHDPERFDELPSSPWYGLTMISVQACEFLITVFKVQPCWRWYQIVYVSFQAVLLVKAMYDLFSNEVMIARTELKIEIRKKEIADQQWKIKEKDHRGSDFSCKDCCDLLKDICC